MVSLGTTLVELQQTLSAYLAAFGFMMLLHGPLSDAFGRRPLILCGLVVYLLASTAGTLAGSLGLLLSRRTFQELSVDIRRYVRVLIFFFKNLSLDFFLLWFYLDRTLCRL